MWKKASNEFPIIYKSDDVFILHYLHLDKENQAFSGRMQFHNSVKCLLSLVKSFLTFILKFLFGDVPWLVQESKYFWSSLIGSGFDSIWTVTNDFT